jgi:hypothetical protein
MNPEISTTQSSVAFPGDDSGTHKVEFAGQFERS